MEIDQRFSTFHLNENGGWTKDDHEYIPDEKNPVGAFVKRSGKGVNEHVNHHHAVADLACKNFADGKTRKVETVYVTSKRNDALSPVDIKKRLDDLELLLTDPTKIEALLAKLKIELPKSDEGGQQNVS